MLQTPPSNEGPSAGELRLMQNKCFLYIDGYPRNAEDIPFNLSIDWGDGTPLETYTRLHVEKIPALYHIYEITGSYTITVTIENSCGKATQLIPYEPYVPPSTDEGCMVFYNFQNPSAPEHTIQVTQANTNFDARLDPPSQRWAMEATSYFSSINYNPVTQLVECEFVTDIKINLPLEIFPSRCEQLQRHVFDQVSAPFGDGWAVSNVGAHLGPMLGGSWFLPPDQWIEDVINLCPYIGVGDMKFFEGSNQVALDKNGHWVAQTFMLCGEFHGNTNTCRYGTSNTPGNPGNKACTYFDGVRLRRCPDENDRLPGQQINHPWDCEPMQWSFAGYCYKYETPCPEFWRIRMCPNGRKSEKPYFHITIGWEKTTDGNSTCDHHHLNPAICGSLPDPNTHNCSGGHGRCYYRQVRQGTDAPVAACAHFDSTTEFCGLYPQHERRCACLTIIPSPCRFQFMNRGECGRSTPQALNCSGTSHRCDFWCPDTVSASPWGVSDRNTVWRCTHYNHNDRTCRSPANNGEVCKISCPLGRETVTGCEGRRWSSPPVSTDNDYVNCRLRNAQTRSHSASDCTLTCWKAGGGNTVRSPLGCLGDRDGGQAGTGLPAWDRSTGFCNRSGNNFAALRGKLCVHGCTLGKSSAYGCESLDTVTGRCTWLESSFNKECPIWSLAWCHRGMDQNYWGTTRLCSFLIVTPAGQPLGCSADGAVGATCKFGRMVASCNFTAGLGNSGNDIATCDAWGVGASLDRCFFYTPTSGYQNTIHCHGGVGTNVASACPRQRDGCKWLRNNRCVKQINGNNVQSSSHQGACPVEFACPRQRDGCQYWNGTGCTAANTSSAFRACPVEFACPGDRNGCKYWTGTHCNVDSTQAPVNFCKYHCDLNHTTCGQWDTGGLVSFQGRGYCARNRTGYCASIITCLAITECPGWDKSKMKCGVTGLTTCPHDPCQGGFNGCGHWNTSQGRCNKFNIWGCYYAGSIQCSTDTSNPRRSCVNCWQDCQRCNFRHTATGMCMRNYRVQQGGSGSG